MIYPIKATMDEANYRGITTAIGHKHKNFKQIRKKIYNIYLTTEELIKINELDLSDKPQRMDDTRDLFLIGAFTGLRYSDYADLDSVNVEGDKFIITDTKKTNTRVVIPQHRVVRAIIRKRDGVIPKMNISYFNAKIKEIAELAGIDDEVVKNGDTYKKHELVSSHTARRSFATNLYKEGLPILSIMLITGHKSLENFMNYIKISEKEMGEKLINHPYFR